MKTYQELLKKLIIFRQERSWEQFHKPKDLSMAAAIEAAELMQEFLWKTDEEVTAEVSRNKQRFADEIADTVVYLMLLANDLGIDMYEAIDSKMKKNGERYPVDKCRGKSTKYTNL
ncbi:MAG: nucleotide pyrophosphohydrolase [Candidatus Riflebacteria bacterium HGW-Riflebacteria-2]|jgi:NTP pyrophosphatase (non-canonical NTP hydrolase)|nr:MAG: nucleotide pyrophosphohydrolase [Candidatus Riflebacteria bacterium HGW-Riflebacteria-2]